MSPFTPSPELFPFTSRWFESPVGTVHYVDEGRGLPILFLHGNPTWSFLYREILRRLRDRFRCVAVDYPGFGLSHRPPGYGYTPAEHARVVLALVRHLDLRELTIMGQDWGGPIGMEVALKASERVTALVFGNTWYWRVDAFHIKVFSRVMASPPLRWLILHRNYFVRRMMPRAALRPLSPQVMEHYRRVLPTPESRRGVAEFPRQLLRSGRWLEGIARHVPGRLGHLPLLLPWGTKDFAFPFRFTERFRRDFPGAEVVPLEAKHFIQEDAPGEVAEAIARFLG